MAVQLRLLGLPRLMVDGRIVAVSWPRRTLALLAFLSTSRGAVPRDTIAFALWPEEEDETARPSASLVYILRLRCSLNATVDEIDPLDRQGVPCLWHT
jgi:DNA-binding SARP family transcriptional activator